MTCYYSCCDEALNHPSPASDAHRKSSAPDSRFNPPAVQKCGQRCRASERIGELLHRLLLFLDAFHQAELRAAAVEVVPRPVHAEVSVAAEEIRQEPDADGEGDEFAGKGDERALRLGQKRPGPSR